MASDRTTQLTIVVSAMLGEVPDQGGWAWAVLQYLLGLRLLGHEVYFVEPISRESLEPAGAGIEHSRNAKYFGRVLGEFGLAANSALLLNGTQQTVGLPYDELRRVLRRADLFLNISGRLTDLELVDSIPVRVYLDLDPAFTQLWNDVYGIDMNLAGHTHFVSVGNAVGQAGCDIPTCGVTWMTTNQPVVLPYWPKAENTTYDALTTVANWRGYGSAEYQGEFYGQKVHSLREFIELPRLTKEKFILALGIHSDEVKDLELLKDNGWQLLDPLTVADSPTSYQRFVQASKAEFGIAKSGYVKSQCGWFSDRSICYLASGRPVIAQETGFSLFLPTGEGLFAFETTDDVLAAIDALNRDYRFQSHAARSIAEECFDSDKLLTRLLQRIGVVS